MNKGNKGAVVLATAAVSRPHCRTVSIAVGSRFVATVSDVLFDVLGRRRRQNFVSVSGVHGHDDVDVGIVQTFRHIKGNGRGGLVSKVARQTVAVDSTAPVVRRGRIAHRLNARYLDDQIVAYCQRWHVIVVCVLVLLLICLTVIVVVVIVIIVVCQGSHLRWNNIILDGHGIVPGNEL